MSLGLPCPALALGLLLLLPGTRSDCGPPPKLNHAVPSTMNRTEGFPVDSQVTYRCSDGFLKIPGKSDTVVCLSNSQWSNINEFCGRSCGVPTRLKFAALSKEDERKNYHPVGITVRYTCRPGYENITEMLLVSTCLENLTWSEAPEFCRRKSCGHPGELLHGRADHMREFLFGAKIDLLCEDGYKLIGRPFIQCELKGDEVEWSKLPTCQVITCSSPPYIANGTYDGRGVENFAYNSTVTYRCDRGFRLIGAASIHCTTKDKTSGIWSGSAPKCNVIICFPPPNIANGMHNGSHLESFDYNSSVTYKCDHNFSLTGEASIHCTTKDNINGVWNGSAPECKVIITQDKPTTVPPEGAEGAGTSSGLCGTLPTLSRAIPRDANRTEGFPINAEVTYKCVDGFVKIPGKSDTVVCLSNSEWSTIGEFCGRGCGAPPRLKSAALSKEDEKKNYHPSGSTVSYVCRPGYERTELTPVITCLENLIWSETPEFCRGKTCGVPKGPERGRAVDITNDLYGAKVNIICDDGFRLRGRTFIQCLLKGDQVEWSPFPTCQAITCSPPPNIANGTHNGSKVEIFHYNSLVIYKCDHNFSLTGEASIHCTTKDNINGVWNGSAPECKGLCGTLPTLSHAIPHDANRTEGFPINAEWSTIGEFCNGHGIDKPSSISISIIISAVIIVCAGIIVASIIIWQKKKHSYSVSLDSQKHHITTEHDFQMSETKSYFILKA
ncbi:complement component receptor 1-like protein [Dermochelys coriacea]|uniref:complement component receptor 1-like protein n=1 Tax=Dermochelys coriacea TaxID=27794 RepID=UPI001CAA3E44|nr:complement component receptor 1-like protein [Dermochelys coriacea]